MPVLFVMICNCQASLVIFCQDFGRLGVFLSANALCKVNIINMVFVIEQLWVELLAQYDFDLLYHLGMANMVANALSHQEGSRPKHKSKRNQLVINMIREYRDLELLGQFNIGYTLDARSFQKFAMIRALIVRAHLLEEIVRAQGEDHLAC